MIARVAAVRSHAVRLVEQLVDDLVGVPVRAWNELFVSLLDYERTRTARDALVGAGVC